MDQLSERWLGWFFGARASVLGFVYVDQRTPKFDKNGHNWRENRVLSLGAPSNYGRRAVTYGCS